VNGWSVLADLVLVVHASYVAFVVVGLAAIVAGWALDWRWVRNAWFRGLHLVAIGLVFAESMLGVACPLTVLENAMRWRAGEQGYPADCMTFWLHRVMFFNWPPIVFLLLYAGVTIIVAAMYRLVPPRPLRPRENSPARESPHDARLP
jgi:hypothetical protein